MVFKLIGYGLLGIGAYYAFTNLDFKIPGSQVSKAAQYQSDKFWGNSALEGGCESDIAKEHESCKNPRLQGLIRNSGQYDPRIVQRWKDAFYEDLCQPKLLRTYKDNFGHQWCKPYTRYVVDYDANFMSAINSRDVRQKFLMKDDKFRLACFYHNERPKFEQYHSVCPEVVLRNLDTSTDDWSVLK